MKSQSILVLACLVASPAFAQGLPDEINYSPYEARYQALVREGQSLERTLAQSRSSLAEAQKFIREMSDHIRELETLVGQNQREISRLRKEIPELERQILNLQSEDARVNQDLRGRQQEESNLLSRYREAERDLRPLEESLQRKEQRLRELQSELAQFERQEREAQQRLGRSQAEAERIDRTHLDLRNQERQLREEQRTIGARISGAQTEMSGLQNSLSGLNSNLNAERGKLGALNNRVSEYESELARLRAQNAPPEEIAMATRKLEASRNTRERTQNEVRSLESQVSRTESQIRTLNSEIENLRRSEGSLPNRISQLESRIRQLESQRRDVQGELNRYATELETARRNVSLRGQQVAGLRQEMRGDEQEVMRQRQLLENINRQVQSVRSEITSLSQESRSLRSAITSANETISSHRREIPRREQENREAEDEMAQGERDLEVARKDETTFTAKVAREEAALNELIGRRNSAQREMDQRLDLYHTYLVGAEKLGTEQALGGIPLGKKEGERQSIQLSKQNGSSVGSEMGVLEARYWASVRGEIEGYEAGLTEGRASQEDIARAEEEAQIKAHEDAELFAQKNFRPQFFEEFVQEEFKRPLREPLAQLKSSKVFRELLRGDVVSPLSAQELSEAEAIKTPLDQTIHQHVNDLKLLTEKVRRLRDPSVTFESPSKIPYGSPDCSKVYKGLPVFKASCEGAYKGAFSNNYVASAQETFSQNYSDLFDESYESTRGSRREAAYPGELKVSSEIGKAEGVRVGKIEIFESTFARTYETAYKTHLEKARIKAKGDAKEDMATFLKERPLLTISSTVLSAENFRGGEEVMIKGKVKNVGQVPLTGPVIFRITSLKNAEKIDSDAVLNSAGALAVTDLPSLKIKVLPTAKAGEKLVVKGVVDLPGDLYKPMRQESFELVQDLTANPLHRLGLEFNRTPEIKGAFRRYIHTLSAKISPELEDIVEGYEVSLSPKGEASSLMEMKVSKESTGALKVGSTKDLKFSYVFKDQAKGKNLSLELTVSYLGKVIKKETVVMTPR